MYTSRKQGPRNDRTVFLHRRYIAVSAAGRNKSHQTSPTQRRPNPTKSKFPAASTRSRTVETVLHNRILRLRCPSTAAALAAPADAFRAIARRTATTKRAWPAGHAGVCPFSVTSMAPLAPRRAKRGGWVAVDAHSPRKCSNPMETWNAARCSTGRWSAGSCQGSSG
jgi:hypothetical protein